MSLKLDSKIIDKSVTFQNFLFFCRSIEVSPSKLIGHYQTDIFGRNLVLDGPGGIRVYNLPFQHRQILTTKDSDSEEIVDDWEQLTENVVSTPSTRTEIFIPDCCDLEFNLLKGYIPMNKGGNKVGMSGKNRDRTASMRWMVQNYQKIKCDNGDRLFDVDFCAGNNKKHSKSQ